MHVEIAGVDTSEVIEAESGVSTFTGEMIECGSADWL